MKTEIKVGDKVKIAKSSMFYCSGSANPVGVIGEVAEILGTHGLNIVVSWGHVSNFYNDCDLELVESSIEEADNTKKDGAKKFDNKKPDMQLIPMAAAFEEANVWTFGKAKYDAWNWYKGISYSRILSALERHLTLLKSGQDFDYENGLHNGAAIRCCAAMLIQFTLENRTELDDRIPMSEENKEKMNKMAQGISIKDILSGVK